MQSTTPAKPVVFLSGEIKTPPFGTSARQDAGNALRRLQEGDSLSLPLSRPMPSIGRRCHELRIAETDETTNAVVAEVSESFRSLRVRPGADGGRPLAVREISVESPPSF